MATLGRKIKVSPPPHPPPQSCLTAPLSPKICPPPTPPTLSHLQASTHQGSEHPPHSPARTLLPPPTPPHKQLQLSTMLCLNPRRDLCPFVPAPPAHTPSPPTTHTCVVRFCHCLALSVSPPPPHPIPVHHQHSTGAVGSEGKAGGKAGSSTAVCGRHWGREARPARTAGPTAAGGGLLVWGGGRGKGCWVSVSCCSPAAHFPSLTGAESCWVVLFCCCIYVIFGYLRFSCQGGGDLVCAASHSSTVTPLLLLLLHHPTYIPPPRSDLPVRQPSMRRAWLQQHDCRSWRAQMPS